MIDKKLMQYFKFDEADLQANREGRFSEKQKNNLSKSKRDWKRGNLTSGFILVALGLGIAVAILAINWIFSSVNDAHPHLDLGAMITAGMFLILLGGLGFLLLLAGLNAKQDISKDRVKKTEGPHQSRCIRH